MRALVLACALALGLLIAPASSSAAGTCATQSNYFDGAKTTTNHYYGVWATIEKQTPALCTGGLGGGTSVAWTALVGHAEADGLAQVGYGNFDGTFGGQYGMHVFSQSFRYFGDTPNSTFLAAPAGSQVYEAVYSSVERNVWMVAGGTLVSKTTFDPYTIWASPVESQIFAETWYCADDVIGTQSNAAAFDNVQGELSPGGPFANFTDLALQVPDCSSRHHNQWGVNPRLFYTWTYPL
jgi:hypothetical protein